MRRRLAPIEASPSTCTGPTWLPWPTWVPPHSSREKSPTSTTRTTEPYLSPNSEIAPAASASARLPCQTLTSGSARSWRLTAASISARRSAGTAWKWAKSKRSRPASTSEPCWRACSPSMSRSAQWRVWVAVWLRATAPRRSASTSAWTVSSTRASPDTTRAVWTEKPSRPGRVSVTWSTAPLPVRTRPVSPTWPPPSA